MSSIVDDILDLLPDTLVAERGYLNEVGSWTASGDSLNLPCRIEGESRLIRDPLGREVASTFQVIVGGYNDLSTEGFRYTLPSRYNPRTQLTAIMVEKETDEDGPCYEVVWLP